MIKIHNHNDYLISNKNRGRNRNRNRRIGHHQNYYLYFCYGGLNSETIFTYIGVSTSLKYAMILRDKYYFYVIIHELAHESMNFDNNFTYVGKRSDCREKMSFCFSGGGFVIEKSQNQKN